MSTELPRLLFPIECRQDLGNDPSMSDVHLYKITENLYVTHYIHLPEASFVLIANCIYSYFVQHGILESLFSLLPLKEKCERGDIAGHFIVVPGVEVTDSEARIEEMQLNQFIELLKETLNKLRTANVPVSSINICIGVEKDTAKQVAFSVAFAYRFEIAE